MDGGIKQGWPALLLAALLSQGCGTSEDEFGRRANEGPALPLKKPIYSLEESAKVSLEKEKSKRPRRRILGSTPAAKSLKPLKPQTSRNILENPKGTQPDFTWNAGLAVGFVPQAWPKDSSLLLVENPKGLKSQSVESAGSSIRLLMESDGVQESRHIGGIRMKARHARGLLLDFELDSNPSRTLQTISVLVSDRKGRSLGRYRKRWPKLKTSPLRQIQEIRFDHVEPDFEIAESETELEDVYWIEILFQIAPESAASVTLHQIAVLPAPPEPVEILGRDSFLKVEALPEELGLEQRMVAIQNRVDRHGGHWKTWFESLESARQEIEKKLSDREGYLATKDGHVFAQLERISHLPNESWPGPQIKGLTALDQFLKQRDIALWIVPVPASEQLFADRFLSQAPEDGRVDVYRDFLLQSLMRQNLNVIDVWDVLRHESSVFSVESRPNETVLALSHYYPGNTDELTARGRRQVARRISESLVRLNLIPDLEELGVTMAELEIPATLTQHQTPAPVDYEWAQQVLNSNGTPLETPQSGSQVLLIGDEATVKPAWLGTRGVGIAPYITLDTGLHVQTIVAPGTSPHFIEKLVRKSKNLLQGKQVCILVLSEQLLYQNGDSIAPIWETTENLGSQ